jgi:hypothetical protein
VVCPVCNGKGGFRKLKNDYLDSNWTECAYCDSYGFVDDTSTEEEVSSHLLYNRYKTQLTVQLSILGDIITCTSEHEGHDMFIRILPFNREPSDRKKWTTLIKHLLKFSENSEKVNVFPKQAFYPNSEEYGAGYVVDWELHITTHELKDLEGLVEVIKFYNETVNGGTKYLD